jgi:hypothetical protein
MRDVRELACSPATSALALSFLNYYIHSDCKAEIACLPCETTLRLRLVNAKTATCIVLIITGVASAVAVGFKVLVLLVLARNLLSELLRKLGRRANHCLDRV